MLLTVDIGNSNIVIGGMDGRSIVFISRIETNSGRTADQYAVDLMQITALYNVPRDTFSGAVLSSVVPALTDVLFRAIIHFIGKEPLVVGPGLKTGLDIRIDNPSQLGSDIVANAVAAITLYPSPLIFVDMGTATTISVIGKGKTFLGCSIMPGIRISADALTGHAAQLQSVALETPAGIIGTNTVDSIKSGVVYGAASMLDGMFARMSEAMPEPPKSIILTGGNARFIQKHLKTNVIYDPNLLLTGLSILYEKNVGEVK